MRASDPKSRGSPMRHCASEVARSARAPERRPAILKEPHEPRNAVVVAILGRALRRVRRPDRDLRKIGVEDINSDLATFIRTVIVLISLALILFATGKLSHPGPISSRSWIFLLLSGLGTGASWLCYFPGAETRAGDAGGADRQIERGAGGAVRRGVSGRAALVQRLARHRADHRRRGADCIQALTKRFQRSGCGSREENASNQNGVDLA